MAEINMKLLMDASVEEIHELAQDIGELVDLVPEWQQMEAEEIVSRIGERLGSWIKARQVK